MKQQTQLKQPAEEQCSSAVLVVDDDLQIRRMLTQALEEDGLPVESAADGYEALRCLARMRPALVLLDMSLPYLDGPGVAARIRAIYGMDVPIVVLTADSNGMEKARQMQATACFQKPFDLFKLLAIVHHELPDHWSS